MLAHIPHEQREPRTQYRPNQRDTMHLTKSVLTFSVALITFVSLAAIPCVSGQDANDKHKDHQSDKAGDAKLTDQILELQLKLKRLEAALQLDHQENGSGTAQADHSSHDSSDPAATGMKRGMKMKDMGMKMGMKGMKDGMGMGMGMKGMKMGMDMGEGGMQMDMGSMMEMMMKKKGMGSMMRKRGMGMMGMMRGDSSTAEQSALPGFPGASHIYHIGSTDFFLDHEGHVELTSAQKESLRKLREASELKGADIDRKIDQAEQELWVLTSSDHPDIGKITSKVKAIGQLNTDNRIAFIRSVGEAAKVLTDKQIKMLVGTESPEAHDPSAHDDHSAESSQ